MGFQKNKMCVMFFPVAFREMLISMSLQRTDK